MANKCLVRLFYLFEAFYADNTSKVRAVGNGADFLTLYPQPLHNQPIYKLFEAIAFT